jgi:predicted N-acetyltransferase YhbS
VVLGPMGVRPDYQGRGIGSELVRRGLNEHMAAGSRQSYCSETRTSIDGSAL